jgi:pyruvate/2-oxoglutarate dehydrogenase complex dihydrolipoamide acyltransferase (E2) component
MNEGFSNKVRVNVDKNSLNDIIKTYKKLKKYQKSSLYTIKTMDGTETTISSLIQEAEGNPL